MTLQQLKNYIAQRIPFGRYKDTFNEVAEFSSEQGGLPYKVYTALLTQSGTDAPVATVLENTLGVELTWERYAPGLYKAAYSYTDENKIIGFSGQGWAAWGISTQIFPEPEYVTIYVSTDSQTASDNLLNRTEIEIRVYN